MMRRHKVITLERGDGYAARCEDCTAITFACASRSDAREALLGHEEAPDNAGTTLSEIAVQARAEGVAPSVLIKRALRNATVNDVISDEVRILIADRDLDFTSFAELSGIPSAHIAKCLDNLAEWTLTDACAIDTAFENDWLLHVMTVMQSAVDAGHVALNPNKGARQGRDGGAARV